MHVQLLHFKCTAAVTEDHAWERSSEDSQARIPCTSHCCAECSSCRRRFVRCWASRCWRSCRGMDRFRVLRQPLRSDM